MALTELLLALCIVAAASVHAQKGDRIHAGQSLLNGQSIVSANELFEMRFFSADNPNLLYLGIRYKDRPPFVWVANRDTPVNSSGASLHLTSEGDLIIADGSGNTSWSTRTSSALNAVVQLRDNGNLVLTDGASQNVLWQSFDHPGNTLLPGMKLGFDFSRNLDMPLTSWKSPSDPSKGVYSYKIDTSGVPEFYIWEGTSRKFRTGPWSGYGFSPEMNSKEWKHLFEFKFVDDQYEVFYSYGVISDAIDAVRVVLNETGVLQRYMWSKSSQGWSLHLTVPKDSQCDKYTTCGPNAYCVSTASVCKCLDTFRPMRPRDWGIADFSSGCSEANAMELFRWRWISESVTGEVAGYAKCHAKQ